MTSSNIVCVDFDGTMVDHCFPDIGLPVPGAVDWMRTWTGFGIKIILFTMRSNGQVAGDVLTQAVQWISDQDIQLWAVNHNPDQHSWTRSPKPYAPVYVDDAAFGCPMIHPAGFDRPCVDWAKVGPGVLERFGITIQ